MIGAGPLGPFQPFQGAVRSLKPKNCENWKTGVRSSG